MAIRPRPGATARGSHILTRPSPREDLVARLYGLDPAGIQIFHVPALNVVKISPPRPMAQGSPRDRDVHAGQHHVPLASLVPP
ncbi:DUF4387 family protein [Spirillospora sp. CA-142024]|uniref:DUF4387 family protein n=1 Tax=Spirillospora sp. CA-142024 TaxID=3240036 RepID=UPI003D91F503